MNSREQQILSARIKEEAQRLGFEIVGISPVKPPLHAESFAEWLRRKLHGELGYMERTEALRRNPNNLVPWAASLVSVSMNYFTPPVRPDVAAPRAAEPSAPGAAPQISIDHPKGWISRYAWGGDYHDLMSEKLDLLLEAIRGFYEGPLEGRAFVDTGPVLERDFAAAAPASAGPARTRI